jgi:hypothetical protein
LRILNESQRRAIALFLLYGTTDDDEAASTSDSIRRFWWKYLPSEFTAEFRVNNLNRDKPIKQGKRIRKR